MFELMNIKIESYSQGPKEFNPEVLKKNSSLALRLTFSPRLRYSQNDDIVGFQLDINAEIDKVNVLRFGFLLAMTAEGFSESLKELNGNLSADLSIIYPLCDTLMLVATGAIASFTATQEIPGIILPEIKVEEFAKIVTLLPLISNNK